jgi:longin-like protein
VFVFLEDLEKEFRTMYSAQKIEDADRPYAFVEFGAAVGSLDRYKA